MPPALLLVRSRALPGFKKSRSLTERSSGAAVPRSQLMNSPPGATALRRRWAAPRPQWRQAAGGGRPNSDVCPLLRCEGEGDARQPRLALTQVQQPVRAKLSAGLSSAASFSLPSPRQPTAQDGFAKVRSGTRGHLSLVLEAGKVACCCCRSLTSPRGQSPLSAAVSSSQTAGLSSRGR